jgi:hypothetical protein
MWAREKFESPNVDSCVAKMKRRGFLILALLLAGMAVVALWFSRSLQREPTWNDRPLSAWLDTYYCSIHFDPGDSRYPPYSDRQIAEALDGIGTNALPFLKAWLVARPSSTARWLKIHLSDRLPGINFGFPTDEADYEMLAETGFQYYGSTARSLWPWLKELSQNSNPKTRMVAYEAAFFTRPEKEDFLWLADRALRDTAAGCEATAAQWMAERFPDEARKCDLPRRFPEFFTKEADHSEKKSVKD